MYNKLVIFSALLVALAVAAPQYEYVYDGESDGKPAGFRPHASKNPGNTGPVPRQYEDNYPNYGGDYGSSNNNEYDYYNGDGGSNNPPPPPPPRGGQGGPVDYNSGDGDYPVFGAEGGDGGPDFAEGGGDGGFGGFGFNKIFMKSLQFTTFNAIECNAKKKSNSTDTESLAPMKQTWHVVAVICALIPLRNTAPAPSETAKHRIFHALDQIFDRKDESFPAFPSFGSGLPSPARPSHPQGQAFSGFALPFSGSPDPSHKRAKDDGDTSGYGPQGDLLPDAGEPDLPQNLQLYALEDVNVNVYHPGDVAYEDNGEDYGQPVAPHEYVYSEDNPEEIPVEYEEYPSCDPVTGGDNFQNRFSTEIHLGTQTIKTLRHAPSIEPKTPTDPKGISLGLSLGGSLPETVTSISISDMGSTISITNITSIATITGITTKDSRHWAQPRRIVSTDRDLHINK
eukprot:maker-scaffold512_size150869-snap-gene-0.26 protein:Tk03337 transcript:maker-scaffold512_size150869-snap-gene-0.26-mRNA-1 annotation:"---NA---"